MRDDYGMHKDPPTVRGERPLTYAIRRPPVAPPWLPKREDGYDYGAELKVGVFAWLEPVGSETKWRSRSPDTKRAVAELLSCETDFLRWLDARESMFEVEVVDARPELQFLRGGSGFGSRARKEALRLVWLQHKNLRQRFDKRLRNWAKKFGSLGIEDERGLEHVDDMMRCALAVREWAAVEGSEPTEGLFTLTFPRLVVPDEEINRRANECTRASRAARWTAPNLWSAICFDLRRSDELGWRFGLCAAEDCRNVFLHTTAPKTYCAPRCGKRMRDHAQRQTPSE
jgi:hypothetical protein